MAMTSAQSTDLQGTMFAMFRAKRRFAFAVPLVILAYLIYIFFAFDVPGIAGRAKMDNAKILLGDFWSYKTHVTRDNRSGDVVIAIENESKGTYPAGMLPEWVSQTDSTTRIDLGKGYLVEYVGEGANFTVPGYGLIDIQPKDGKLVLTLPPGPVPDWINASDNRVAVTTPQGRFNYTRSKVETLRYQPGWELFFFTLESPFYNKSPMTLLSMAVSGDRVDPARSNASYIVSEVWNNKMWRHKDVVWAIGETILMAFLGTISGAMIALPLSFLAAKTTATGITLKWTVFRFIRIGYTSFSAGTRRFFVRRVFDFVRGVDSLIWTIILSRAFGPGPMTGALAMMITDIGSFGKTFSEALENIDEKQVEGIRSTGANSLQRARFGIIPQIAPVLLSQVLYFLESNTRSATVIGAIVGGGIGLLLTQAISTQKDWEEVAYYMVLIVLMVMLMDSLSGWIRRKLIKGGDGGH